nr:beta-1,3-galactosyltransferase 1-like [Rhipicephalus microplus]
MYCMPQCTNRAVKDEISLHSFPLDVRLKKEWVVKLRIGKPVAPPMKFCSAHFVTEDFLWSSIGLAGSNTRPFLAGYVTQGRKTVRRAGSKWYMPLAVYEPNWLPSYIHGSGYVVSRDAVRPFFAEALATSFLYAEDIFLTGVVAQKVGIELTNSRCFIPYSVWQPCDHRNFLSTHEWDLEQLRIAWQSVHYASDICPPANESLLACS